MLSNEPTKSVYLTMLNNRCFGKGHRTALSIDKDFDPAENVNALSSTLISLYRVRLPLFSVEL